MRPPSPPSQVMGPPSLPMSAYESAPAVTATHAEIACNFQAQMNTEKARHGTTTAQPGDISAFWQATITVGSGQTVTVYCQPAVDKKPLLQFPNDMLSFDSDTKLSDVKK
ncbi:hypothetical protein Moror_6036 [Moniliophthora roreri MCA 2997]|uniref:Uncharacterized protein n=1 Tax=Moniliophthora roreri (strain MCA 2997) TaxID=1381753 RepID=V2W2U0_MONRO|nr:hypothetical protein Moror_6036 [Moniliophthora roreri MCA 2997]